jgi:glycosyltransferase involved in cell wall biosynthesis
MNIRSDQPLVSILIPVYNRSHLIGECIDSALNQSFDSYEIIIVDNHSDDGTWEICLAYAQKDARIRLYRNESNVGPVHNWIRCAGLAKGKFSKLLFSDDLLLPNCLKKMVPLIQDQNVGFVFSGALIGNQVINAKESYINIDLTSIESDFFCKLVLSGKGPVSPCAVLLRTDDLRQNILPVIPTAVPQPFAKHGAGPDVLLLLMTAEKYRTISHIPIPLVFFRVHDTSFSIENKDGLITDGYYSALSYYLKKKGMRRVWLRYVAKIWLIKLKTTRVWISPKTLLLSYEGSGTFYETTGLIYEAFCHISARVLGCKRAYN